MKPYPNPEQEQDSDFDPTEPIETIDKIMIACQTITFIASKVHGNNTVLKCLPVKFDTEKQAEFYDKCWNDTDAYLQEVAHNLKAITEELCNYTNNRDFLVEGHEHKIIGAALDALYDRDLERE